MAVREEIDLFGGPDLVFGCRHLPALASGAGVLVCLGAPCDGPVDEGRAARLGRRLADVGVAVQRFHYRGAWPSDGDPRGVGFDTLVEDAARALDLLRDRADVRRVAFVGARLGALVAARLARAEPGAAVALWAPVPDPRSALEQAARARRARDAASSGRLDPAAPVEAGPGVTNGAGLHPPAGGTVGGWPPDEATAGSPGLASPGAPVADDLDAPIDLFDTPLASELAEGATVRNLADELGRGPRPLLLAAAATSERETIAAGCHARGLSVEVLAHTYDDERDGGPVPGSPADELIDRTARWLAARLAAGAPAGGAQGTRAGE
jgi:alpha/beta superfamily hydrolase